MSFKCSVALFHFSCSFFIPSFLCFLALTTTLSVFRSREMLDCLPIQAFEWWHCYNASLWQVDWLLCLVLSSSFVFCCNVIYVPCHNTSNPFLDSPSFVFPVSLGLPGIIWILRYWCHQRFLITGGPNFSNTEVQALLAVGSDSNPLLLVLHPDLICLHCNTHLETIEHLFLPAQ